MFVKGIQALEHICLNTLAQGKQLKEEQGYLLAMSGISQLCR